MCNVAWHIYYALPFECVVVCVGVTLGFSLLGEACGGYSSGACWGAGTWYADL